MNQHHRSILRLLLPFILSPDEAKLTTASFCTSSINSWSTCKQGKIPKKTLDFPTKRRPPSFHPLQRKDKKKEEADNDIGEINNSWEIFDMDQIETLKIRLDATVLATYVLGRFLVYDVTTGIKATPGWELHDVIMIFQTFSSAILLSAVWTLIGVFLTGIFRFDNEPNWRELIVTTIIAAPIWILVEISLSWPTAGVLWMEHNGGMGGMFLGNQEVLFYLFTLISTSTLGVGCTIAVGRFISRYIT